MTTREFIDVFPEIVVIARKDLILGIYWDEIWNWAKEQGIDLIFKNHWSYECKEYYSFEIKDEEHRLWFKLKFAW